ncbi:50S ribosomal protein L18 [Faecalibacter rhinopitheci]|uniref:Large ribosomal subunit protein uL18 n=1 Tax=Faecalibacter rhinopitheci TaxID=2779678 RepID=A0A8J7FQ55_9FLAO|nr:50S ribosomal protein L18 [Faecalibacter rhinopitheci]MBF0597414.1 50S ribosomal protein L18 [Faecalibacter rhinopitheci]MBQ0147162.1 50S ribosomal protein L18 [Candidatus Onthonaster equi]
MALSKVEKRQKIKRRVRRNIFGTAENPRLSVYRSNKEIYAQIIDDNSGVTIVAASSREEKYEGTKTEISGAVGKALAAKAIAKGVETVVFDRNGFVYHGRIQALADGAREGGLKF